MGAEEARRTPGQILSVRNFCQRDARLQIPFLTPVLYCCHSLSASGVVPKNSPTHSRSFVKGAEQNRAERFTSVNQWDTWTGWEWVRAKATTTAQILTSQKYDYRCSPESTVMSEIAETFPASLKHLSLTSNCPDFFWMVWTRLNKTLSFPSTSPQANLQTHSFTL